jgi:hypothetical protein
MVKLFDTTFLTGSALVLLALAVAFLAITRDQLPIVGTGVGALLAVAVIGMAGCAVGGISQAPALGWTAPTIVFGTVLGLVAILIVAAGVFGWTPVLEPIARFVPAQAGAATPVTTAIFALAVLIGVKWVVAIGMAVAAR